MATASRPGVVQACFRKDSGWEPLRSVDRGIGGTGRVADKGLGGTGVVGVITGFGSICVNGVEIFYDENTPVMMDGRSVEPGALKLGQVATAFARPGERGLDAEAIVVNHALVGAVEAVDAESGALRVLGVTVDIPSGAGVADVTGKHRFPANLKVGDSVAVSGLWKPNGHVDATCIDQIDLRGGRVSAAGLARRLDSRHLVLGGIPVALAPATVLESEVDGHTVLVSGRWNGSGIEADKVELQPIVPFCEHAQELNLEGYVTAVAENGNFILFGAVEVIVSPDSEISGAKGIEQGMRVWVHGPVQGKRRVVARQIRVLGVQRVSAQR